MQEIGLAVSLESCRSTRRKGGGKWGREEGEGEGGVRRPYVLMERCVHIYEKERGSRESPRLEKKNMGTSVHLERTGHRFDIVLQTWPSSLSRNFSLFFFFVLFFLFRFSSLFCSLYILDLWLLLRFFLYRIHRAYSCAYFNRKNFRSFDTTMYVHGY